MTLKNRFVRFAFALTIAGAIATQIPVGGGIALARDGYNPRSGTGSTGRTLIQVGAALLVGYGLYTTAVSPPVGGATPTTTGGGSGGGTPAAPATQQENLFQVINGRDDMKSFGTVAENSGMRNELEKDGDFTVFVPTNSAFENLGAALTDLQKPENKSKLAQIIGGHIITGRFTIDQLKTQVRPTGKAGKTYQTINGQTVTLTLQGDKLYINGIAVSDQDITASNGIIHPIGQVITGPAAATN